MTPRDFKVKLTLLSFLSHCSEHPCNMTSQTSTSHPQPQTTVAHGVKLRTQ